MSYSRNSTVLNISKNAIIDLIETKYFLNIYKYIIFTESSFYSYKFLIITLDNISYK